MKGKLSEGRKRREGRGKGVKSSKERMTDERGRE